MTSEYTKDTTLEFFKTNRYFGLQPKNVIVFEQDTLPCLSFEGKVILDQKNHVARAPNGNGGLYLSLVKKDNNVLEVCPCYTCTCMYMYVYMFLFLSTCDTCNYVGGEG